MIEQADYVIIGGGFYGLYSATVLAEAGAKVIVLERDANCFARASYVNQARIHLGFHYPRSLQTAKKTASYFTRFNRDYDFCVNSGFNKIYAIATSFSYTNPRQFEQFCEAAGIPCRRVPEAPLFNSQYIAASYETTEYTYDARMLCEHLEKQLKQVPNAQVITSARLDEVASGNGRYRLLLKDGRCFETSRVLNATYASINQVNSLFGAEEFAIKYELCEVILCDVDTRLADYGITVMDGPFFSIMPFGHTGKHSLTSVAYTPHLTSYTTRPRFPCQDRISNCTSADLANCNHCAARPKSAWPYMSLLARKYLNPEFEFSYSNSLFAVKSILLASELDDSRPTVIRRNEGTPLFRSVLSGKINTVYDLRQDLLDDLETPSLRVMHPVF